MVAEELATRLPLKWLSSKRDAGNCLQACWQYATPSGGLGDGDGAARASRRVKRGWEDTRQTEEKGERGRKRWSDYGMIVERLWSNYGATAGSLCIFHLIGAYWRLSPTTYRFVSIAPFLLYFCAPTFDSCVDGCFFPQFWNHSQ